MKNVLMISYYYPPKGGAGVQRATKFAKYLNRDGYSVSVLTVNESISGQEDISQNEDIEKGIKIYRTDIDEPAFFNKVIGKATVKDTNTNASNSGNNEKRELLIKIKNNMRKIAKKIFFFFYNIIFIPDDKKGWIKYATDKAEKIIKENDINVIFSTSYPYSSHIIGYKIAKKYNIPWIADFRDPWVKNSFADYSTLYKIICGRLEKKIIKKADAVISVSEPIIDNFIKRYSEQDKSKFYVIPNGYDEDDFKDVNLDLPYDKIFTILYSGSLYGKESPDGLINAVDSLLTNGKIDKNKICIKFIGEVGFQQLNSMEWFMNKYSNPNIIEIVKTLPHKDIIKQFTNSAALLLILDFCPGSNAIYTGKIFEYIRAKRPIIGIVPDGVARDLIIKTNTGYVAYPDEYKKIEDIVYKLYSEYYGNGYSNMFDKNLIQKHDRHNLTMDLETIIDKLF